MPYMPPTFKWSLVLYKKYWRIGMIFTTLHMNLTTLAMYPAKGRQIQNGGALHTFSFPFWSTPSGFSQHRAFHVSAFCWKICTHVRNWEWLRKSTDFYSVYAYFLSRLHQFCVKIRWAGYNLVRAQLQASQWQGAYKSFLSLLSLAKTIIFSYIFPTWKPFLKT